MLNGNKSSAKMSFRANGGKFHIYRYNRITGIVPHIQIDYYE